MASKTSNPGALGARVRNSFESLAASVNDPASATAINDLQPRRAVRIAKRCGVSFAPALLAGLAFSRDRDRGSCRNAVGIAWHGTFRWRSL
jgi:hypothetical protein